MDDLLTQITNQTDGLSFLPDILGAFEQAFEEDLHIKNGSLFEDQDGTWAPIAGKSAGPLPESMAQQVIDHGSYIFDQVGDNNGRYTVPAGFFVTRTLGRRWLFLYELTAGWSREETAFAMNAVRFALNARLRQEAVASDIAQAAEIQQSLLPESIPVFPGYEIAARSVPAEDVGGDFYDFLQLDTEILGVSTGDASGHGIPAALLVRDVMTGIRMGMEAQMKMLHTLKRLNNVVHRSTYSTRFISVFYAEIERNGNILYANAGHQAPMLFKRKKVVSLEPTGMILGPLPEIRLERSFVQMAPGNLLLLYTDGIAERFNEKNEMLDTDGVRDIVQKNRDATAEEIVDILFKASLAFGRTEYFDDDATAVVIKRLAD